MGTHRKITVRLTSPDHVSPLMRSMLSPLGLPVLLLLCHLALGRVPHSPEDPYAFPKHRINFINGHPVTAEDAEGWLASGVKGGVEEFMGSYRSAYEHDWPQIGGNESSVDSEPTVVPELRVKRMQLGRHRAYLCLIPPMVDVVVREVEEPPPIDPVKSWSLLQPLTGRCLYHRQGWFTYAYCHNHQVRQFRERAHAHPHPPGGRIPQEDADYESYTLGKSPESLKAKESAVAIPEDTRLSDLQLSEGADQRYLTTKWTGGTACDKTGRPREIEIQFHCSMTTMDQIQFLKETSVCRYLMVIHTPRLCGEPGFQSVREKQPAAPIHCREIISSERFPTVQKQQAALPEAPYPNNAFDRNPSHYPDPSLQQKKKADAKAWGVEIPSLSGMLGGDAIQKAIQKLLGKDVKVDLGKPETLAKAHGEAVDGVQEFDLTWGVPIQGEDGEEMYVQVLDLEGRQGQTPEELLKMVQDAISGAKSKVPAQSEDEDEDEDERLRLRDEL